MTFAKELGLKQMIISTFWLPKERSISDWLRAADEANKMGERTRAAGIQLGFHNHDFEFHKIGGELIYDKLMGEFDPQLIKMQFQVERDFARLSGGGLFREVSRPIHLHPPARLVANEKRKRCRSGKESWIGIDYLQRLRKPA